ncbi:MAG TPA: 4-(cytidine 5'-diphospho)-2-C-methyl-D-erythritol kinase [Actinomycetota bacterium]|nr:4-(cytidine 5'-diphospho)-2-C-methyl-D-erythritol kinase [Actinomycetota bacterium]
MTESLPDTCRVEARAKVNLFLRVLGRRPDGYHDLETLIVPIELTDHLEIHAHSDPAQFRTLALSLEVSGDPALVRDVPLDDSNLVLRAARSLADEVGARGFADIALEKRVPAAAGLGGGSSDAAAALRALNDLWECHLDDDALSEVGQTVGSDVPALLLGGAALARGRGERVEPVSLPSLGLALVTFRYGVSTADAFRWWDEDGGRTGPDPEPLLAATRGGDPARLGRLLYNDLEDAVIRRHPAIGEAKERLLNGGAAGVVMCGSGPSLAALIPADGSFEPPPSLTTTLVRTFISKSTPA